MKPKTLMLLVVAGGCGLVAMMAVQQAMNANAGPDVPTVDVLVALESIETGAMLTEDKVTFQKRPADTVPEDAVTTPEQFAQRGARVPLFTNDVITMSKLTEPGGVGNSMKIPKGMRVITIPVTADNNQSNLISPGDRVDVIVSYQARGGRGPAQTKTKTLLEYVEVFATGDQTQDRVRGNETTGQNTTHISLLLMPEQVNYVKLAQSKGNLSLAWRHRLDDEFVAIKDIDEELLEELEGTVGINELRPLFDLPGDQLMSQLDRPVMNLEVKQPEVEPSENSNLNSLLSTLEQDNAAPPVAPITAAPLADQNPTAPVVTPVVEDEKPKWTIQVYNGNEAKSFQFEDATAEEETEDEPVQTSSIADTVRSLWAGVKRTKSGQEKTSALPFTAN